MPRPTPSERPILFSGPMVRAILSGAKTQTRRVVKERDCSIPLASLRSNTKWSGGGFWCEEYDGMFTAPGRCPYGAPGDRLWVRETFALAPLCNDPDPDDEDDWSPVYRADGDERAWRSGDGEDAIEVPPPWRPSIHMPRWASRITLDVTGVRVERLHDISEADAKAEGVTPCPMDPEGDCWSNGTHRSAFEFLWNEINGWNPNAWDANPWVWVVEFPRADLT